jgi:hypothetical protein
MTMAVTTGPTSTDAPATRSTLAPSKVAAEKGSEHAARAGPADLAGSDLLQTMSRMVYSGSYALAYGIVYATVFIAQSLPQENPVMHGLSDGRRAAVDELNNA